MWVIINNHKRYNSYLIGKLELAPHDFEKRNVTFHIEDETVYQHAGIYELHIRPTWGRELITRGTFPVGQE